MAIAIESAVGDADTTEHSVRPIFWTFLDSELANGRNIVGLEFVFLLENGKWSGEFYSSAVELKREYANNKPWMYA